VDILSIFLFCMFFCACIAFSLFDFWFRHFRWLYSAYFCCVCFSVHVLYFPYLTFGWPALMDLCPFWQPGCVFPNKFCCCCDVIIRTLHGKHLFKLLYMCVWLLLDWWNIWSDVTCAEHVAVLVVACNRYSNLNRTLSQVIRFLILSASHFCQWA